MPEDRIEKTAVEAIEGGSENSPSDPSHAAKERPTFICESCGPDKPVEQVYPCTLCTMNYCVKHLAIMSHYCFGALGKSQTIGVSG